MQYFYFVPTARRLVSRTASPGSTSSSSTRSVGTKTKVPPYAPYRKAKPNMPVLPTPTHRHQLPSKDLDLSDLPQTTQSRAHGGSGGGGNEVGTAGNGTLARLAVPDASRVTLDSVLAAEGASITSVLADLHLLHLLSQRGTVTSTIFTGHADLLGALGHLV
jgi:hypothetical protein